MNRPHAGALVDESQTPVTLTGLAIVVAVGALLLNIADLDIPGRFLLAVVSLLTVPGIPIAMALPIAEIQVQMVLGVALSLAAVLLVSALQLALDAWSPIGTQVILLAIGLGAATLVGRSALAARSATNGRSVSAR